MKKTKTIVGLIVLLFIINIGFFAQREAVPLNISEQENVSELISPSDSVEKSTDTEVNVITYERNEWELDNLLQRTTTPFNPVRKDNLPSYSIVTVQYVPHVIIQIDGNADFLAYNFTGQGTITQPYIIANLSITASHTHLIFIRNTDAYFEIRDNYLNGINR
ncbi:hypothetical protein CEE45_08695 [Candidatus Heimdallarchaeota archaeon B3_Heim]|nr:MAG: hypothetical protein CEE45_08695 [Candidatus Heimdallarchaeota archaeon B3_Heim]